MTSQSLEKLSKIYESEWGLPSKRKDKEPTDVNPIHSIGGRSVKGKHDKPVDKEMEF